MTFCWRQDDSHTCVPILSLSYVSLSCCRVIHVAWLILFLFESLTATIHVALLSPASYCRVIRVALLSLVSVLLPSDLCTPSVPCVSVVLQSDSCTPTVPVLLQSDSCSHTVPCVSVLLQWFHVPYSPLSLSYCRVIHVPLLPLVSLTYCRMIHLPVMFLVSLSYGRVIHVLPTVPFPCVSVLLQ